MENSPDSEIKNTEITAYGCLGMLSLFLSLHERQMKLFVWLSLMRKEKHKSQFDSRRPITQEATDTGGAAERPSAGLRAASTGKKLESSGEMTAQAPACV